jgi:hypothetical protein
MRYQRYHEYYREFRHKKAPPDGGARQGKVRIVG